MRLIGRYKAKIYQNKRGISPYKIWFENQQITSRVRFETRLMNIEEGNIGDHRWVGDGVWELKKDIKKAKEFWSDYLSRKD